MRLMWQRHDLRDRGVLRTRCGRLTRGRGQCLLSLHVQGMLIHSLLLLLMLREGLLLSEHGLLMWWRLQCWQRLLC